MSIIPSISILNVGDIENVKLLIPGASCRVHGPKDREGYAGANKADAGDQLEEAD